MNRIIDNINFKKVIGIYIILLIISIIGILIFVGSKYYDKLSYLYNYHRIDELIDKKYNQEDIEKSLSKLSEKSKDIIDIVIINNNEIIYSTTNKYKNNLTKIANSDNFYKDSDNNFYKLENKKDFVFRLFSIGNEDDYYDKFNINNVDYTLTYLKNDNTNDKIIFVNKINDVQNGILYLKISLAILILFFMLYWIITSLIVYQNAKITKLNSYFWGIVTLFTNIIGVGIYLIYINNRIVCKKCNTSNDRNNIHCVNCGNKINTYCKKCHTIINKNDKYCKSCGEKI